MNDDLTETKNWSNLVVLVPESDWVTVLVNIWKRMSEISPKYYEIRCRPEHRGRTCIGLDFRFFSKTPIKSKLVALMKKMKIAEDDYDINPKLRTDDKAVIFAKCSGSYKGVDEDEKHTPTFLDFLSKVSELAVNFLSDLETMRCEHPDSQEPRNEVSHLFRNMMGIQDLLDRDFIRNQPIVYDKQLARRLGHLQ